MLHDLLWERNSDLANACLTHPFVQQLADGSLDRGVFERYLAQDGFFLRAFLRAYAIAAAKARDPEQTRVFHDLMGGVLDELKVHAAFSRKWDVSLDCVEPLAATRAYTNFLMSVSWHGSLDEIVAAMVPCMRLYAFLGTRLAGTGYEGHLYGEWIAAYSGAEFEALASRLESLLDAVADDTVVVGEAYRYAMQCELDFFSSAMDGSP
jgi:thiaminase/transcriptional activator TenA